MDSNYSLSDIVSAVDGGRNCGMNGFGGDWVAIILFALIFGNNGFGYGNNGVAREAAVTESALCNSMNFNNLENAVGRMNDMLISQTTQLSNAACNLGYENLKNISTLSSQVADCCCTTQRAIDNVNYNIAMSTASINQTTTEQTQRILDKMCADKEQAMQARINQLELKAELCGVVRYPSGWTYNAGNSPFCSYDGNMCCNR